MMAMPAKKPRRRSIEQQLQIDLIQLRDLYAPQLPELRLLHHIPNGGWRSPVEAKILKAMGTLPGVPDLHLAIPRPMASDLKWYASLYIEMKKPGGSLSDEQADTILKLIQAGNCVQVCESVDFAWSVICWYLGGSDRSIVQPILRGSVRRILREIVKTCPVLGWTDTLKAAAKQPALYFLTNSEAEYEAFYKFCDPATSPTS